MRFWAYARFLSVYAQKFIILGLKMVDLVGIFDMQKNCAEIPVNLAKERVFYNNYFLYRKIVPKS